MDWVQKLEFKSANTCNNYFYHSKISRRHVFFILDITPFRSIT